MRIVSKVLDLERQLKSVKEEKAELEVSSDRAGFLEAQVWLFKLLLDIN